jgi:hypothetical protein
MKPIPLLLGCAAVFCVSMASAGTAASAATGVNGKAFSGAHVRPAKPVNGAPGAPVSVQLDYTGLPKAGAAVTYMTEGGLTLGSAAQTQLTPDATGTAHDTVVVQAKSAGVYYLNVFTNADGVSNAVSIPVTVGSAVLKPRAAKATATPSGNSVIEMPAQQTVK